MVTGTRAAGVVSWQVDTPGLMVVTLNRPPANALGLPVLDGLHAALDAAEASLKVMIVASAVDGFFAAGADIRHMSSADAASFAAYGDRMRAVNDRLAAAPWISVAAVDGLELGGGLELAMSLRDLDRPVAHACHDIDCPAEGLDVSTDSVHLGHFAVLDLRDAGLRDAHHGRDLGLGEPGVLAQLR
jgi:hypothetical protein